MSEQTLARIEEPTVIRKSLSAAEIKTQVQLIQQVMSAVMKDGTHYGKIPGCGEQKVLLKAGAEKLLMTFRIATEPIIEDLSTDDEVRYRVIAKGTGVVSAEYFGSGIGECSSLEEKYKWRRAVCDEEFEETPEDRKRTVWKKGFNKPNYQIKQVRTNKQDVANTVLKMAKKRALVDLTLTVTAASDIFTQDLEEMEPELAESIAGEGQSEAASSPAMPQRASAQVAKPAEPKAATKIDRSKMRSLKAKFESKCVECTGKIQVGEDCLYDSDSKKVAHIDCGGPVAADESNF